MSLTHVDFANICGAAEWIDGVPWNSAGRILSPISMPHVKIGVDREAIRNVLNDRGLLLARWTDCWDLPYEAQWWWTCCDRKDYDVDTVESPRGRRDIRKGLRSCQVRMISLDELLASGWKAYGQAHRSYGFNTPRHRFEVIMSNLSRYPGTEFWAAFVDQTLAAFASCQVIDNAVVLGVAKSDPELRRFCPNNALFYTFTKEYLVNRSVSYVTNGCRTLLHDTTINDLLVRMGYRRVYARVNVELSRCAKLAWHSRTLLQVASRLRPKHLTLQKFNGFVKLMKIARTFHD